MGQILHNIGQFVKVSPGSSGPVKKSYGRDRAGPTTYFPGLGRDRDWVLTQKICKKGQKTAKKQEKI